MIDQFRNAVFVDAFYWIAITNPGDSTHVAATAFDTSFSRPNIVTTEEVLTEFLTYFAGRGPMLRKKAAAITAAILTDPSIWVLPQTHESFLAGLALYAARFDKAYSLADCISMQSMRPSPCMLF